MTASTSSSGADAPAVTPTVPRRSSGSSSAWLTRKTRAQPDSTASFSSARVLELLADPMTTTTSHRSAMRSQGLLPVGRGEAEVAAARRPEVGEPLTGAVEHVGPVAVRQGRLGQQCHRGVEFRQRVDLVDRFDPIDRRRRDRHRADGLLVALVADVDDPVALVGSHLHLVVDLGHERAHGVDDVATGGFGRRDDLGGRTVGRQHESGVPGGTSAMSSTNTTPWSRKRSTTSWLWTISW